MKQHSCPRKLLAELCEGDHYQFETYLKNKPLDPAEELETALDLCFYMSQTSTFNKGHRLEFKTRFMDYYHPILQNELSEWHQTQKCNWVKHQGDWPPPVYLEFEGGDDTKEAISLKRKNKIIFISVLWGLAQAGILKQITFKDMSASLAILFREHGLVHSFRNYPIYFLVKEISLLLTRFVPRAYERIRMKDSLK